MVFIVPPTLLALLKAPSSHEMGACASTMGCMIIVTGHLTVDAQDRDAFLADCLNVVGTARTTSGCLDFAMSADPIEEDRVNVLERWESEEALKAFRGSGPDDESGARIVEMHVHDYEVSS